MVTILEILWRKYEDNSQEGVEKLKENFGIILEKCAKLENKNFFVSKI